MEFERFMHSLRIPAPRAAGRSVPPPDYNPELLGMAPLSVQLDGFVKWLFDLAQEGVFLSATNISTSSVADRVLWRAPGYSRPLLNYLAREALAAGLVVQVDPAYKKLVPVTGEFVDYLRNIGHVAAA